jgi:hypothetical protein
MEYRCEAGSRTWHFHRDCPSWPHQFNLIVSEKISENHEICPECIALRDQQKKPDEK